MAKIKVRLTLPRLDPCVVKRNIVLLLEYLSGHSSSISFTLFFLFFFIVSSFACCKISTQGTLEIFLPPRAIPEEMQLNNIKPQHWFTALSQMWLFVFFCLCCFEYRRHIWYLIDSVCQGFCMNLADDLWSRNESLLSLYDSPTTP